MSKITNLEISNFKSIIHIKTDVSKFTPIVGYNNSGKSNFIRSIYWLLKKSALHEKDFHNPQKPVWVSATIDNAANLISTLPPHQQQQISPYIYGDTITVRRIQLEPNATAAQIKIQVLSQDGTWKANPTGLDNAIGKAFPDPVYIKAMDDAEDDVAKFSAKNTIGLLIKYAFDAAKSNNTAGISSLTTDIGNIGTHLNGSARLTEIDDLETSATANLNSLFPGVSIRLDIPTPSLDEIIKATTIKLVENGTTERNFSDFGHGTQRTVQMALINLLAQYTQLSSGQQTNTVILIDEPELYLHPQAVGKIKTALESLSNANFQIFFSTHSPMMIGRTDSTRTQIFWKCPTNGTQARGKALPTLGSLSLANANDVLFALSHSSQWLFCEKPLIVEGKTERTILPTIFEACSGRTLQDDSIALIESGGATASRDISRLFSALGYSPKRICDMDFVFKVAPNEGLISQGDPDVASCKAWFANNCTTHNISLDQSGLPQSNSHVSAERAYELMAADNVLECEKIHTKLLAEGIWIWQKGAVEAHLGVAKNNQARANFVAIAQQNKNVNHASHPADLNDLVSWLTS